MSDRQKLETFETAKIFKDSWWTMPCFFGETAWFTNDGILEKCNADATENNQILLIKLQGGHQANRSKIDTHLSSQQSNYMGDYGGTWGLAGHSSLFHLWAGKKNKIKQN